ncbi:hypothetical protein [Streptomyces lavendulae]|nr:phytoene dehydrogenase-like protein [Streptomyces sp. SPB4]
MTDAIVIGPGPNGLAAGRQVFGRMMSMLGQSHGFPVPVGGAGTPTAALVSRLRRHGGGCAAGR